MRSGPDLTIAACDIARQGTGNSVTPYYRNLSRLSLPAMQIDEPYGAAYTSE